MDFKSRNKKRLLSFLIIPLLAVVPIISDDFILKTIAASILIIYVGFIIFLRDSVRIDNFFEKRDEPDLDEHGIDDYKNNYEIL